MTATFFKLSYLLTAVKSGFGAKAPITPTPEQALNNALKTALKVDLSYSPRPLFDFSEEIDFLRTELLS